MLPSAFQGDFVEKISRSGGYTTVHPAPTSVIHRPLAAWVSIGGWLPGTLSRLHDTAQKKEEEGNKKGQLEQPLPRALDSALALSGLFVRLQASEGGSSSGQDTASWEQTAFFFAPPSTGIACPRQGTFFRKENGPPTRLGWYPRIFQSFPSPKDRERVIAVSAARRTPRNAPLPV